MQYDAEKYITQIKKQSRSGSAVFLYMLQEECAELIQAVSKLLRASGKVDSPTDVSLEKAITMVREEMTDVQIMIDAVLFCYYGIEPGGKQMRHEPMEVMKWERWKKRMEDENGDNH